MIIRNDDLYRHWLRQRLISSCFLPTNVLLQYMWTGAFMIFSLKCRPLGLKISRLQIVSSKFTLDLARYDRTALRYIVHI